MSVLYNKYSIYTCILSTKIGGLQKFRYSGGKIMQIYSEKFENECNKDYIYFAHLWSDYLDKRIFDYLQNSRHLTKPDI